MDCLARPIDPEVKSENEITSPGNDELEGVADEGTSGLDLITFHEQVLARRTLLYMRRLGCAMEY